MRCHLSLNSPVSSSIASSLHSNVHPLIGHIELSVLQHYLLHPTKFRLTSSDKIPLALRLFLNLTYIAYLSCVGVPHPKGLTFAIKVPVLPLFSPFCPFSLVISIGGCDFSQCEFISLDIG